MKCDEFQSLLDNYESLSDEEKLNMTLHTAECAECRADLDFMLSIINVTKNLPPVKASDNFISELNKKIDIEEMKQKHKITLIRRAVTDWKRYGAVAACLLLAVVVGFNSNSLISDMSHSDNGIIIEEVVTSTSTPVSTPEIIVPQVTMYPVENVTPETQKTEIKANKTVTKPSIKPEAQKNTPKPQITSKPEVNVNVAVQTQKPEVKPTDIPVQTPSATEATVVVSDQIVEATEAPYTLHREGYRVSEDPAVQVASVEVESENNIAREYSVAGTKEQLALGVYTPLDRNGNPTDYDVNTGGVIADSPTVDSILVSSEDEAVVRDLISRYITGNYGMYYMSTEDKLNRFFEELDKAGISYEKFLHSSTNKISFKLVIVS